MRAFASIHGSCSPRCPAAHASAAGRVQLNRALGQQTG